jgi:hypothetical protein
MYYEPDTVWGRTIEGDEEVATPRSGLSLVQRRVLSELGRPRTFATLAARHNLDAPKLEHELISLAERRLVAFQRPGSPQPRTAPRINLPMNDGNANAEEWKPALPVYFLAAAVGISTVLILIW